jgi:integrase
LVATVRAQKPPLAVTTWILQLIALRCVFNELACSTQRFELARLIRREDIPRAPQRLPRPLIAEQDQILQREFCRRNDLGGNVFLLLRHTGMRISECADLSFDCLRSPRPDAWAIHVPLGKLQKERMVPVHAFVRDLVHRLRFFRSLDPKPPDQYLLARTGSKKTPSSANCAITCIRSATRSVFLLTSFRTRLDTLLQLKCCAPESASPSS